MGTRDFFVRRAFAQRCALSVKLVPAASAARAQTFTLEIFPEQANANDLVEAGFRLCFSKRRRNDDDGERAIFTMPVFNLREPAFADARMKDGLEFFSRAAVGKNDPRKLVAFQFAGG